jgi:nicotinamide-nucleotide amidase
MIPPMRAGILAVGSELLGADRLDTNSLKLTEVLLRYGVPVCLKSVVGDCETDIAAQLRHLLSVADLVLVTGGLGPTADDVSREATAVALGRNLVFRDDILAAIASRFERMGRTMPEVNRRQAFVLEGATILANPKGTAPGLRLEEDGKTVFLFPGVPHELLGMIGRNLEPWLREHAGAEALETVTLRVAMVPESEVEEAIAPAYLEFGRDRITILATAGDIRLRLTAAGQAVERSQLLAQMSERLACLVGQAVYSRREEDDLETVVGQLLRAAGATVATAESCTGGLVAERLTRVAGSSDYFVGGAVAYANRVKHELLGVVPEVLKEHGAVSEAVARALAEGACRLLHADWGIGLTGIAGPGGATPGKPVGTVHVAVAGLGQTTHRVACLPGDRERVRQLASQMALEMLRRRLLSSAVAAA